MYCRTISQGRENNSRKIDEGRGELRTGDFDQLRLFVYAELTKRVIRMVYRLLSSIVPETGDRTGHEGKEDAPVRHLGEFSREHVQEHKEAGPAAVGNGNVPGAAVPGVLATQELRRRSRKRVRPFGVW